MADELVNRVMSVSTDIAGRSLNSAGTNHFVIDEPAYNGGPGEALTPADAFLSGVSACGVLLVESFARRDGVPLRGVRCAIEGVRSTDDPANFSRVSLRFELEGVSAQQADRLVEAYKGR